VTAKPAVQRENQCATCTKCMKMCGFDWLTLVLVKNDDVRGLSYPSSASLTSLRRTGPKVLCINLGLSEKYCVVNVKAHAVRRHKHATFADQRLEPPQLSQTLSASPRAAAIDRAASTVPQTHGMAGSHAELSPAVGPTPDSECSMPSTSLLSSAWHKMRQRPPEELAEGGRSTRTRRSSGWAAPNHFRARPRRCSSSLADRLQTFTVGVWWPAELLSRWWRTRKPRAGGRPASGRGPRTTIGAAPAARARPPDSTGRPQSTRQARRARGLRCLFQWEFLGVSSAAATASKVSPRDTSATPTELPNDDRDHTR